MSNFRETSSTKNPSLYKINVNNNKFLRPISIEPNVKFSNPTSKIKDQNFQNNKFQITNPPHNVNNKILVNKDKLPSLDDLFSNLNISLFKQLLSKC